MGYLNRNLLIWDRLKRKVPLFYITIFFWTYYLKKEWIICKILYISKSYFYFSSFLFSLSFSALYYILQKMLYRIASPFINFYFPIVVIEEGAFYRAPFKILSSHTISLKRRQMLWTYILNQWITSYYIIEFVPSWFETKLLKQLSVPWILLS